MLFGRSIRAIRLSQAVLDVITCFLTAALAAALAPAGSRRRIWIIALWLAATCPFVANYSAVVLTEVLVTFLATAALCCFTLGLRQEFAQLNLRGEHKHATPFAFALFGAFLTGVATLVRPEMPLLLGVAAPVYALRGGRALGARKTIFLAAAMAGAFLLPLLPWAARNWITLHEVQFLVPPYLQLPGRYVNRGFFAWTNTWLVRYQDIDGVLFHLDHEPIQMDNIPASAFDNAEEGVRVDALLQEERRTLEISPEVDRQFAELARERTARHPLPPSGPRFPPTGLRSAGSPRRRRG